MNNKFWNAPAWSMANRYEGKSIKKSTTGAIPGPGTYDLAGSRTQVGCRIGTSNRNGHNNQNQPGPGNYNISSKNEGPKISMSNRFGRGGLGGNSFTPGPGNYNTSGSVIRPSSGVTMGAKYGASKILNQQPGPGTYNLNDNKKSGVKIGTSKRTDLGGSSHNPGPGQYGYDKRPDSAGPRYGFGRSGRDGKQQSYAPGPGQYDAPTYLKGGQLGCTMGQRFKKDGLVNDMGPGPGYYDSNLKKYGSGTKIGKAKRGIIDNFNSPGPGAYDNCYKSLHGGTRIGTSKRGDFGRAQTPGPGAYDTLNDARSGITISGHRGKSRMQNIPGPGAYNPDDFNKGRPCSANIGKGQRSNMRNEDTPGPGQYYHHQGQSYKFAHTKQLRSKDLKMKDPGPGQYQIPSSVPSAPHYLIDPNIYKSLQGGSHHHHA